MEKSSMLLIEKLFVWRNFLQRTEDEMEKSSMLSIEK